MFWKLLILSVSEEVSLTPANEVHRWWENIPSEKKIHVDILGYYLGGVGGHAFCFFEIRYYNFFYKNWVPSKLKASFV